MVRKSRKRKHPGSSQNNAFRAKITRQQLRVEQIWEELKVGVAQVYSCKNMSKRQFMTLYTMVHDSCNVMPIVDRSKLFPVQGKNQKKRLQISGGAHFPGTDLYKRLREHIKSSLQITFENANEMTDSGVLELYTKTWTEYSFASKVLNGIFAYMNRHFARQEVDEVKGDNHEAYWLTLTAWRDKLLDQMNTIVAPAILRLIEKERNREIIDSSLISGIIRCYVELGPRQLNCVFKGPNLSVYKSGFEQRFLHETEEFYRRECSKMLTESKTNFADYLRKAENHLKEEQKRVQQCLHESSFEPVMRVCDSILIGNNLDIFHAEFTNLLANNRNEDLARVYWLVSRIESTPAELSRQLEEHITEQGCDAIGRLGEEGANNASLYVQTLLAVYYKYHNLIATAFNSNVCFRTALDKACQQFVNKNNVTMLAGETKSAELLAKYCDMQLRKNTQNSVEHELDDTLNQVVLIFQFITDKDVYQKYYQKHLASRLINQRNVSLDVEISIVARLKHLYGYEFTTKLQRMLQDMTISTELNNRFHSEVHSSNIPLDVDFHVLVLTSGSWPWQAQLNFQLPPELERTQQRFINFYKTANASRKLAWVYSASSGEIVSNCFSTRYTFEMSTCQMTVLLLYNDYDALTMEQLQERTQIRDDCLRQAVDGLLRCRLLQCADTPRTPASVVYLCLTYKSKKVKVNVNGPMARAEGKQKPRVHDEAEKSNAADKKKEEAEEKAAIEDDRKYVTQACIIRVMKARLELRHNELVAEVIQQLSERFQPSLPVIKLAIETLMDKDYLARGKEHDSYRYVA